MKISLILCCNQNSSEELQEIQDELCSDVLKKFKGQYSIFVADRSSLVENDKYYIKNLNLSPSKSKCGCLLKKWDDIPGREKSPIRSEFDQIDNFENVPTISISCSEYTEELNLQIINQQDNNKSLSNVNSNKIPHSPPKYSKSRNCISPDLFESESESEYILKSPDMIDDFSQSLLSPSKKQKSQSNNFERRNTPTCTTFDSDLQLIEEEIEISLTQRNSLSTKNKDIMSAVKDDPQNSENENTEELYLNSLKAKEEMVINLTLDSSIKKYNEAVTKRLPLENKSNIESDSRKEEFIVDLTLSSSSNDSSSYSSSDKIKRRNTNKNFNEEDSDINFEMSPLHVKDSIDLFENEVTDFATTFSKQSISLQKVENRIYSRTSFGVSFEMEPPNDGNTMLNVTDYVNHVLNQNESEIGKATENKCVE